MRYENQAFENQTLVLDGNEYIGCTFKNCTLVYSASGQGGNIEPLSAEGLQIQYEGAAKVAIELHDQIIEAGVAMAPIGAYLRIGPSWFQRIAVPSNVGSAARDTVGLAVIPS